MNKTIKKAVEKAVKTVFDYVGISAGLIGIIALYNGENLCRFAAAIAPDYVRTDNNLNTEIAKR